MRFTVFLLQLSLWVAFSEAFFPWFPKYRCQQDDTCKPERRGVDSKDASGKSTTLEDVRGQNAPVLPIKQRASSPAGPEHAAREAERLAGKYLRFRSAPTDSHFGKRQNVYKTSEPKDTSFDNSAGVWQDGSDFSYFVQAGVGSSGKEMFMLIDTGASTSWVMGTDCDTSACEKHESFGPDDSDTFEEVSGDFAVKYGSGSVKGTKASDTISVAGMDVTLQFGVTNYTSDDFNHFPFDGILGLSLASGKSDNFMKTLKETQDLDKNIFCVFLNRADDGPNTGEISFGACNPDKQDGDFGYTDLGLDNGDWAIPMDSLTYDGQKTGVNGKLAYIDTGTSFVFGPQSDVEAFHANIPGSSSSDGTTWKVPCNSDKELKFEFSGTSYTVSPKDWMSGEGETCTSNIYGHEVVKNGWLLGDLFLKNVYAVFDADEGRIGFATRSESTSDDDEDDDEDASPTTSASEGAASASADAGESSASGTSLITQSAPPVPTGEPTDDDDDEEGFSGHESASPTSDAASEESDDAESSAIHAQISGILAATVGMLAVLALQ